MLKAGEEAIKLACELLKKGEVVAVPTETVYGLAGIGDLIVTASSMNSRNFQAGLKIGQGMSAEEAVNSSKMVVEGVRVLISAHNIAVKYNVYLPIIETAYKVLFEKLPINEAIETIISAKLKKE